MEACNPLAPAAPAAHGTRSGAGTRVGLAVTAALFAPAALTAQQGTIAYTYSQQYEFEVPEGWEDMVPEVQTGTVLLLFSPSASLMIPVPEDGERASRASDRRQGRLDRLKRRSASRGDQEVVRDTWVSYAEGAAVETREFMGRNFRIAGPSPSYAWRIASDQAEHLGRLVIKATAEHDSTSIEAWFTPEIAIPGGPASYGGLPGMILVLSVDGGRIQYFATEIALGDVDAGVIRAPENGDEVSREEYERIVEDKLNELEQLYGRRRGGQE